MIGGLLAQHLVLACTRPGDLVMEMYARSTAVVEGAMLLGRAGMALTHDSELAQAMWGRLRDAYTPARLLKMGIFVHAAGQAHAVVTDYAGHATLVVATVDAGQDACPDCRPLRETGKDLAEIIYAAWRALKEGGHLAVVTSARCRSAEDERLEDPTTRIIRQARLSGFSYTQHVVALRAPIRAGELVVQVEAPGLAQLRDVRSIAAPTAVSVHSDILIFTRRLNTGNA